MQYWCDQRLVKYVFPYIRGISQLCPRGLWDMRVESSNIVIPLLPLKVEREVSNLYLEDYQWPARMKNFARLDISAIHQSRSERTMSNIESKDSSLLKTPP